MPAVPPTSGALSEMPLNVDPTAQMLRPVGSASSSDRDSTCCCVALFTSTTGEAPVTVTVSSSAPTRNSPLMVAVKLAGSSIPSRWKTLKPGSVNVTVYNPGRRSMIRYSPLLSVVTLLAPSMRAGLLASTVTPGSTAPVASLTTPAIALCALALPGENASRAQPASRTAATLLQTICRLPHKQPKRPNDASRRKRRHDERNEGHAEREYGRTDAMNATARVGNVG